MPENKDIITNEDKAVQARRLQEQCFLTYNFEAFAESNTGATFDNFVPIHGDPSSIVQKLLAIPDLAGLMNIKPYLLSSLVPQLRLYKVHYPSRSSSGQAVEIPFDDFLSPSTIADMTASGYSRGLGAGIKSFEWELLGTNPAESDNNIKAKLKLHFNSMQDLLAPRGEHGGQKISFLNLIEPAAKFSNDGGGASGSSEGSRSYNDKYFRIRVAVGYGDPTGSQWDSEPTGVKDIIRNARQFFNLNMVSHSLDFKEHGAVDLEIEYIADSEGALSSRYADVLLIGKTAAMDKAEAERAAERKEHADAVSSEAAENCGKSKSWTDKFKATAADKQKDMLKNQKEAEALDRAILYNALLAALENTGRIYRVRVDAEDLGIIDGEQTQGDTAAARRTKKDKAWVTSNRKVASGGTLADLRSAANEAVTNPSEAASSFAADGAAPEPHELDIHYFHYGDLLNIALRCLYETGVPDLERLKVVTGPYVYYEPDTGKMVESYNMCDIPISLNLFQIWFMDKVIKPQISKYSLKRFVKDSVTSLVGAAMRPECFGKEFGKAPANLSMQMMQVPATDDGKCRVTGKDSQGRIGGTRVKDVGQILPYPKAVKAENADSFPYIFLYVASHGAQSFGPPTEGGREARDAKNGVYHFRLGADAGLVKKINFKKTDQPYAREARMETEGEGGLAFLREKYNADVEMFGNAIFRPGMHVYIDPASVGAGDPAQISSVASMLGLGGYFLVTGVKCAIEAGKFQTDLKCVWTNSGSGKVQNDKGTESGGKSGAPSNCDAGSAGTAVNSAAAGAVEAAKASAAPKVSENPNK